MSWRRPRVFLEALLEDDARLFVVGRREAQVERRAAQVIIVGVEARFVLAPRPALLLGIEASREARERVIDAGGDVGPGGFRIDALIVVAPRPQLVAARALEELRREAEGAAGAGLRSDSGAVKR